MTDTIAPAYLQDLQRASPASQGLDTMLAEQGYTPDLQKIPFFEVMQAEQQQTLQRLEAQTQAEVATATQTQAAQEQERQQRATPRPGDFAPRAYGVEPPPGPLPVLASITRNVEVGIVDAVANTAQAVEDFTRLAAHWVGIELPPLHSRQRLERGLLAVEEAAPAPTFAGQAIRTTTQFLAGFSTFYAASTLTRLPQLAQYVAGTGQAGQFLATLPAQVTASFAALDPESPNMANLLMQLAPAIRGPVLEFLGTTPLTADPASLEAATQRLRNRLANSLTDTALNTVGEGLIAVARMMYHGRRVVEGQKLLTGRTVETQGARALPPHIPVENIEATARTVLAQTDEGPLHPRTIQAIMDQTGATEIQAERVAMKLLDSDDAQLAALRAARAQTAQVVRTPARPAARTEIRAALEPLAAQQGVDPDLMEAVIAVESNYRASATSPKGAQGLMQLMPATAKDLGVANALDPLENMAGGAKYLAQLDRQFPGDLDRQLAAYNAGPGAVRKYNGIPPFTETQQYVQKVKRVYQALKAGGDDPLLQAPGQGQGRVYYTPAGVARFEPTSQDVAAQLAQVDVPVREVPEEHFTALFGTPRTATEVDRRGQFLSELGLPPLVETAPTPPGSAALGPEAAGADLVPPAAIPGALPEAPPALDLPEWQVRPTVDDVALDYVLLQEEEAFASFHFPDGVRFIAQRAQVPPAQAQRALSEALGAATHDAATTLGRQLPPPLGLEDAGTQATVRTLLQGEQGAANRQALLLLLRTALGGALGGMIGDTPEERFRNALLLGGASALFAGPLYRAARGLARQTAQTAGDLATAGAQAARQATTSAADAADPLLAQVRAAARVTARQANPVLDGLADRIAAAGRATLVTVRQLRPSEESEGFLAQLATDLRIEGKVLDINFDRLRFAADRDTSIKQTLASISQTLETEITAARRLGTPQAETAKLAEELGLSVEQFLGLGDGTYLPSALALASRHFLAASGRELDTLTRRILEGDVTVRDLFLQQFALHAEIHKTAASMRSEAGRTLAIYRTAVDGRIEYAGQIEQALRRLGGATPSDGTTVERLAQMWQALPTPAAKNRLVREATKPGPVQAFTEAYVMGLISGPLTHVRNALGNSATVMLAVPERFLAAGFSQLTGGTIQFSEPVAMLYGAAEGLSDAWRLAWQSLKTGHTTFPGGSGTKVEHAPAFGAEAFGVKTGTLLGQALDYLGTAIRVPGRALLASDEFFKAINYDMQLGAEAVRAAHAQGLHGGPDYEQFVAAFLTNPPAEVVTKAQNFAFYQTFQQALTQEGVAFQRLGEVGSALSLLASKHPLMKLFFPFIRTPTNILRYSLERTPGLALASREVRAALAKGGNEAADVSARMAMGATMLMTVGWLASQGRITGRAPADPGLREAWRAQGFQEYSLRLGNTLVEMDTTDPLGFFVSQGADLAALLGAFQGPAEAMDEAIAGFVVANLKNFSSKTFLTGFARLVDLVHPRPYGDPEASLKPGIKTAYKLLAGVEPAVLRQLAQATDPTMREATGLLDIVREQTPGASATMTPVRTIFGEPLLLGHGIGEGVFNTALRLVTPGQVTQLQQHPAAQLLTDLGLSLHKPGRVIDNVQLTPDEYDRVQVLAGERLKATLTQLADNAVFRALPVERQKLTIERVWTEIRAGARAQLLSPRSPDHQPALVDRLQQERGTRRQRLTTPPSPQPPRTPAQRTLDFSYGSP